MEDINQIVDKELVTFQLDTDTFGVNIETVQEIVKVPYITKIPRAPNYVIGVANLRGNIFPVIDTRIRLNLRESPISESSRVIVVNLQGMKIGLLVDKVKRVIRIEKSSIEFPNQITRGIKAEYLEGAVRIDEELLMEINISTICKIGISEKSVFKIEKGKPRTSFERISEERLVSFILAGEEYAFNILYVKEIMRLSNIVKVPNSPEYIKGLISLDNELLPIIDLRTKFGLPQQEAVETNRIIVLDLKDLLIGLIVDKVKEIIRIQKSIIEPPPRMISDIDSDQLYGIIKINQGRRLIMLLKPDKIISHDDLKNFERKSEHKSKVVKEAKKTETVDHFVAFKLGKEEFCINMSEIHEINKLEKITKLPNSPYFVDGVINLRGEVIPIINLRSRFAMEKIQNNKRTRIIIVELYNKRAGIIVDSVSEVFKVETQKIESLPEVVKSNVSMEYMSGIVNLESGNAERRMLVILNLKTILSEEDKKDFQKMEIPSGEKILTNTDIEVKDAHRIKTQDIVDDLTRISSGSSRNEKMDKKFSTPEEKLEKLININEKKNQREIKKDDLFRKSQKPKLTLKKAR